MYKRLSRFMQHLATSGKSSKVNKHFATVPERLKTAYKKQILIAGRITGTNKGGYIVTIDGFDAFCPFSEMYQSDLLLPDPQNPNEKRRVFEFKVIEIKVRSCIVSRIEALKIRIKDKIEKSIREGTSINGTVKTIQPYGAFIDLGGMDGLLHISKIPSHLKEIPGISLKPNDKLSVYVIYIDKATNKISLSMQKPVISTKKALEVVS
jgi:small subunit ribosomal protein S1